MSIQIYNYMIMYIYIYTRAYTNQIKPGLIGEDHSPVQPVSSPRCSVANVAALDRRFDAGHQDGGHHETL